MIVRLNYPFLIKKSVVVFLRSVILIELFFAFFPLLLNLLINLRSEYETTSLSMIISYDILAVLVFTGLQILVIFLTFAFWYIPTYEITSNAIRHLQSNLIEDRLLADPEKIQTINLKQGWIARRMNYGTLVCVLDEPDLTVYLRDIPDPANVKDILLDLRSRAQTARLLDRQDVSHYLEAGEGQFVEFKSSLLWDYRQQRVNKELYEPIMKTLAAFMNSQGGTLLIGIGDQGEILGLEPDLSTMKKQNVDGFENTFNMAFNKIIGVQFRQHVEVTFPELDGKQICLVRVRPANNPVYMVYQGQEFFYARAGNGTQALSVSQASQYIQERFSN